MDTKEIFAERILGLRENKGLARPKVADALGCTAAAIGNYENGKRSPDFDTLIKIADYFGASTDYLLGRDNNMELQYSGGDNALDCKIKAEAIRVRLSLEDQLLQLAEECGELSAAVLKLVRIRRDKSPTPMTETEALGRIEEELTDVRVCLDVIGDQLWRSDLYAYKMSRWHDRLKKRRCRKNESQTEKDSGKDQNSDTVGADRSGAEL